MYALVRKIQGAHGTKWLGGTVLSWERIQMMNPALMGTRAVSFGVQMVWLINVDM